MKRMTGIDYEPYFNQYVFFLEEKKGSELRIKYKIIYKKHDLFDVKKETNFLKTENWNDITQGHDRIRQLSSFSAFQSSMQEIEYYEEKMKNEIEFEDVRYEGKVKEKHVLSFRLNNLICHEGCPLINIIKNPQYYMKNLTQDERIYLSFYRDYAGEISGLKMFKMLHKYFTLGNIQNYELVFACDERFNTYRNFRRDIQEQIIKESSVRVRMLVN